MRTMPYNEWSETEPPARSRLGTTPAEDTIHAAFARAAREREYPALDGRRWADQHDYDMHRDDHWTRAELDDAIDWAARNQLPEIVAVEPYLVREQVGGVFGARRDERGRMYPTTRIYPERQRAWAAVLRARKCPLIDAEITTLVEERRVRPVGLLARIEAAEASSREHRGVEVRVLHALTLALYRAAAALRTTPRAGVWIDLRGHMGATIIRGLLLTHASAALKDLPAQMRAAGVAAQAVDDAERFIAKTARHAAELDRGRMP